MEIRPGSPHPLGAIHDGMGTNFSVHSSAADRVRLCLFDDRGKETRVDLPGRSGDVWHGYLADAGPGLRYGYRIHGPWDPGRGFRCLPGKLLLDPYARAVEGMPRWTPAMFDGTGDAGPNTEDSAPHTARSVVVSPFFDWKGDVRPRTPMDRTVIYEVHVKGFTARHPKIPPEIRGTYAALGHPAAVGHLTDLGITAVELLPVHQFIQDPRLVRMGLRNYWGYNTIGFFAPHNAYAAAPSPEGAVAEFKEMVRRLHRAGLEVILDVVFNHTAESDRKGPILAFKGLDNPIYYRLEEADRSRYVNLTGTGNTVDARNPAVLQLIADSLRYWITEMHVDGFRFDLAPILARNDPDFDPRSAFLSILRQDPVIRGVKLIAEAWDLGPGGYQVGRFPHPWSEWNDRFRDGIRDFWRGTPVPFGELDARLAGSPDLFRASRRPPQASINYITCHDGFTLRDLVSYERKYNAANGEENRDGHDDNRAWNCGVEGETDDPEVSALRDRQRRNFLATLLLSRGVPMILGGDELGRTQKGNNNAYCQDNELTWFDWENGDPRIFRFLKRLIALRRGHPVLRAVGWFREDAPGGPSAPEIAWFRPDGRRIHASGAAETGSALQALLSGPVAEAGDCKSPVRGSDFRLLLNAGPKAVTFAPTDGTAGTGWRRVIDTAGREPADPERILHRPGARLSVPPHALMVLQSAPNEE